MLKALTASKFKKVIFFSEERHFRERFPDSAEFVASHKLAGQVSSIHLEKFKKKLNFVLIIH